jgi:hypothetical protein
MKAKLFFAIVGAGLFTFLAGGCATTDADRRESDMPWNTPQPWEGSPFVPGLDRY